KPERAHSQSESLITLPLTSYLPFGIGNHFCKGERFATFEAKWVLSSIFRRFRVVRLAPQVLTSSILIAPSHVFFLYVERCPSFLPSHYRSSRLWLTRRGPP